MQPSFFIWFQLAFAAVFLFMLFVIIRRSLNLKQKASNFLQEGVQTEGRVVDCWQRVDNGSTRFAPIVEYTTIDGKKYTVKGENFTNTMPRMGTVVPVYYKPSDPAFGMVDPAKTSNNSMLMMIFIALIVLMGIAMMIYMTNMTGRIHP